MKNKLFFIILLCLNVMFLTACIPMQSDVPISSATPSAEVPPEQLTFRSKEELVTMKRLYDSSHDELINFLESGLGFTANGLRTPEDVADFIDLVKDINVPYTDVTSDEFSLTCYWTYDELRIHYKKNNIGFIFCTYFDNESQYENKENYSIKIRIGDIEGAVGAADFDDNRYFGIIRGYDNDCFVDIYRYGSDTTKIEINDELFSDFKWVTLGEIMDGKV